MSSYEIAIAYIQIEDCISQLHDIYFAFNELKNVTRDYVQIVGGGSFIATERRLLEAAIYYTETMIASKKVAGCYSEDDLVQLDILKGNLAEVKGYFDPQWN